MPQDALLLQRIWDLYLTLLAMMTLMTVIHAPLISDGALSGLKAVYSPVSVKSFSETLLSVWLMFIDRRWDTECYPGMPPSVAFIVITNFLSRDLYSI